MKGPYERNKHEFRRLFECPVCHHRGRVAGHLTTLICPCQSKTDFLHRVYMKMVIDDPRFGAVSSDEHHVGPAERST